jgi:hypothetical protein
LPDDLRQQIEATLARQDIVLCGFSGAVAATDTNRLHRRASDTQGTSYDVGQRDCLWP